MFSFHIAMAEGFLAKLRHACFSYIAVPMIELLHSDRAPLFEIADHKNEQV